MSRSWPVAGQVAILISCGHHDVGTPSAVESSAPSRPTVTETGPAPLVVIDAASPKAACVFGHRGVVVQIGDQSQSAQLGPKLEPPAVDWVEREGSTWARVRGKSLSIDFVAIRPAAEGPGESPFLEARVRGGAARTLVFYLNGRAAGSSTVPRGETRVISLKGAFAEPVPGANELLIRFAGVPKGTNDPAAELDWVHFGVGEPDPKYAAPTRGDAFVSASFGGQAVRAISLRGPGSERCEGWIPRGAVVETRARLDGPGEADAEVRMVRDRVAPTVIGTLHLGASDAKSDRVHSWPVGELGPDPGVLGAIELSVTHATKGTRVVFGEPRVLGVSTGVVKHASGGRSVVLLVMSQLGARSLSAYGGPLPAPAIDAVAASGIVFDGHRSTTGVASGAVGSMLTGMTARRLALDDAGARLPHGVTTVADAARQAGIASAFFTANPLTSAAFGFDRGWSRFGAHSPVEDGPATRVFDDALAWLQDHRTDAFLLVVHARGGHPPWDVSLDRVRSLAPDNYTGGLDPRHAAELLGRTFRTPGSYRFEDADRARAWALYSAAVEAEDEAVGRVMAALKAAGRDGDTTVIVTGDVGVNDAARIPFAESDSLDEGALATPLVVRWPHESGGGRHVMAATSPADLAPTLLEALGLPAPLTFTGRSLHGVAEEDGQELARPALATDEDRFALRWGTLVSIGARGRETKLCDLSLESTCVTDVRASYPLASRLLHAALFNDLVTGEPPLAREPATLDPATVAALKAWGR